jgi:hypothetical protein
MQIVVKALIAFALFCGGAGLVTQFIFGRALHRHGLKTPAGEDDWSWAWGKLPPDVSRIRTWLWIWAALFLASLIAAALITLAFDLCPGCVIIIGRGA